MRDTNVLAVVPARGGSKGIPGKNIRLFAGKPLLAHSIEAAKGCSLIGKTVVSTDSDDIAAVAKTHGADIVRRPDELAADNSLVVDAIKHAVLAVEADGYPVDIVLLLEPTSPLRRPQDLEQCIRVLVDGRADSVATFTDAHVSPNRLWRISGEVVEPFITGAVPWLPRQQQPQAFELTGQIYGLSRQALFQDENSISTLAGRIFPVITPRETALDIDTELDFTVAEIVMQHFQARNANKADNTNG